MFYIVFNFAMAVIMFLFGIWFYRSKGQASNFLSGYNMKSAEERKKYDENAMCKAYGKRMIPAFATPAATVPTPASDTSLTEISAYLFAFLRS